MFDGYRERREEEDDDAREVNKGGIEDGVIFAKVLIGHSCTQDGGDIAPALEEIRESGGATLAQAFLRLA